MRVAPNQLSAQLARGLAPAYAVAGEEPLLIVESLDAIRARARSAGFSERETFDADRHFNWNQLVESCATGSLFASQRIVEVHIDGSPGDEGAAALLALLERPQPDVLLVVTAGKLDARARGSKWWTAFEKQAAAIYAWPVRSEEFPAVIGGRLRAAGFEPTPEALALLVLRTEGNLLAAAQEVAKLSLLCAPGRLDEEAVAMAVADSAHVEVFGWIDRLLAGDRQATIRGLQRLREEGEDGLPIIGALAYDLRQLSAIDMRFKSTPQSAAWEDLLTLALAVSGTAIGAVAARQR